MGILRQADWLKGDPRRYLQDDVSFKSRMATEELGRDTSRADLLDKAQSLEEKKYDFRTKKQDAPLRDEQRAASIAKARSEGYRFDEDTEARRELDAISRMEMGMRTNNAEMFDGGLAELDEEAQGIFAELPVEDRGKVLGVMRDYATNNLEMARQGVIIGQKGAQERSVARTQGEQARMKQTERLQYDAEQQDLNRAQQGYGQRLGAGVPGAIAEKAIDDPAAGAAYNKQYIEAGIGAMQRRGQVSGRDMAAAWDKSVADGMAATASTMVTEYSGPGVVNIDSLEEWANVPGWANMRAVANKLVKPPSNATGSDVHDYLTANYLLLDRDQGFIRMPTNAEGERLGTLTARDLLAEARETGRDIKEVMDVYKRYISQEYRVEWKY